MIKNLVRNYTKGRDGYKITAVCLHITEGTASGTLSWFNNPESLASSHYLVSPTAPFVMQLVEEYDTAWHAGKVVRPTWKGLQEGVNPNKYTIGIEVALPSASFFPKWGQWRATALLVKDLLERYNLPLDEMGLVEHREIRADKLCPGKFITRLWMQTLMKYIV